MQNTPLDMASFDISSPEVELAISMASEREKEQFRALWDQHLDMFREGKIMYFIPQNLGFRMGLDAMIGIARRLRSVIYPFSKYPQLIETTAMSLERTLSYISIKLHKHLSSARMISKVQQRKWLLAGIAISTLLSHAKLIGKRLFQTLLLVLQAKLRRAKPFLHLLTTNQTMVLLLPNFVINMKTSTKQPLNLLESETKSRIKY